MLVLSVTEDLDAGPLVHDKSVLADINPPYRVDNPLLLSKHVQSDPSVRHIRLGGHLRVHILTLVLVFFLILRLTSVVRVNQDASSLTFLYAAVNKHDSLGGMCVERISESEMNE